MPAEPIAADKILSLTRAYKRMVAEINSDLKPSSLSFDIWTILQILFLEDGLTMSRIAREAELNSPAATKIVDKMVNENLVYRRHSRSDRRIVNIYLTDSGREHTESAQETMNRVWDEMKDVFRSL